MKKNKIIARMAAMIGIAEGAMKLKRTFAILLSLFVATSPASGEITMDLDKSTDIQWWWTISLDPADTFIAGETVRIFCGYQPQALSTPTDPSGLTWATKISPNPAGGWIAEWTLMSGNVSGGLFGDTIGRFDITTGSESSGKVKSGDGYYQINSLELKPTIVPVPEPSYIALMLFGSLILFARRSLART
jgi:hypothetical protein